MGLRSLSIRAVDLTIAVLIGQVRFAIGNLGANRCHDLTKSISLRPTEVSELCAMLASEERLFVVTASNSDAQRHAEHSIANPIDAELCSKYFDQALLDKVASSSDDGCFYTWGAVPGKRNAPNWEQMKPGDHILVYQNGNYRYWTRVITKHKNMEFAKALWRNWSEPCRVRLNPRRHLLLPCS